jgi:hypothetical protein
MIAVRGYSCRGFGKFWIVDWWVGFWEWNMKKVLVGSTYDFWK